MARHHGFWIGLFLVAGTATAQEDEYALLFQSPKVVTTLRYLKPAIEAPASADVITAEDIRRFGYRTVAEAVSSLPGFQATYDRAYAHLQVRGFHLPGDYNGRILVLIDGHRLNENLQDYAGLDSDFPLAMRDIERIEVVRGPASSLYGSSALLAVIHIISRNAPKTPSLEFQGQAGSFGSHQERLAGGSGIGGASVYLSGTLWRRDGRRVLRVPGVAKVRELDGQDGRRLFGRIDGSHWRLSGAVVDRDKALPDATSGYDPATRYRDRRAYVDLRGEHPLGPWRSTLRLFWDRYEFRSRLPAGAVVNRDLWHGEQAGFELTLTRLRGAHQWVAGTEYRASYLERMDNFDRPGGTVWARNRGRNHYFGAFAQDEWRLSPAWTLTFGGRLDYYSRIDDPVSLNPRAALIWKARPTTTLKLLYGRAFRAPNAFESDYTCCQGAWVGNANLKPEHIHTLEAVIEQQLGNWHLRLDGFHYRLNNLIRFREENGTGRFVNASRLQSHGFEILARGRLAALSTQLSYTFSNTLDANGRRWPDSPRHLVKSRIAWPLFDNRLIPALEANYVGKRPTTTGGVSGDHLQLNLTLSAMPLPNLDLGFSLYNLLDKPYRDPPQPPILPTEIPQDGRTFQFRLNYRIP